jgi:polyhydroxybutyrate depolymerase
VLSASTCFVFAAKGGKGPGGSGPGNGGDGEAGTFPDLRINVKGVERAFRLVVPETVDLSRPAALVFAFHGFLIDDKDIMPTYTGFSELAAQEGFIVVYPNSESGFWRTTYLKNNPDIDLFDALLTELTSSYNVDSDRVYVTGMSNGANFTHLLASQRSHRIAAIAPHSGELVRLYETGIRARRKYPVMIIHGADDQLVPVELARAARDQYLAEGHAVEYFEFESLGHRWASDFNITELIWEFFLANPME